MKTTARKPTNRGRHRQTPALGPKMGGQWAWHYRTLVALRESLLQQKHLRMGEIAEPIEAHGAHYADSGTDEFDHDLALALLAHEEHALREVQDAIYRILTGRYGICEATGVLIPPARLRAIPWCRYARDPAKGAPAQDDLRIAPAATVRPQRPRIPYTGEMVPEGHEPATDARDEPKGAKGPAQQVSAEDETD